MNDSLYIAATAMQAQQLHVDTIANNIANLQTPGYKAGRVSFQDIIHREGARPQAIEGADAGGRAMGVGIATAGKVFQQGEITKTDRPLDLAIRGDGFLEVIAKDGGTAYTRGGSLVVDKEGLLALPSGEVLKPSIHVGSDAREVTIKPDGVVLVARQGQDKAVEIGRIDVVGIGDVSTLVPMGGNLYRLPDRASEIRMGTPGEEGLGTLVQSGLEASNVKMIDEMVNLMVAQRAYAMSVKVIQAADEMLGMSNNLRR
jgi:flagellar basal-body rod protein FlgG